MSFVSCVLLYYCYGNINFIHTYKTIIQLHSTNKVASSREKEHIIGMCNKSHLSSFRFVLKMQRQSFHFMKMNGIPVSHAENYSKSSKSSKIATNNTPFCINIPRKLQKFSQKMWNFDVNINFQRIFYYFPIQCFE